MRRPLARFAVAFLALSAAAATGATAEAQRVEVVTDTPEYQGIKANAPIPPEIHFHNEGGSNGAGLCVICSVIFNGHYQGVPNLNRGKESTIWRVAKGRPGGYSPDKLAELVEEYMAGELWASLVGTDPGILDELSRQGYPIGVTMNTAELYGWAPIHHMVSLVHYETGGLACYVDNNDPGKYHWVSAEEFSRRWIDGGTGWAWIWLRKPPGTAAESATVSIVLGVAFVVGAVVYLLFRVSTWKQSSLL